MSGFDTFVAVDWSGGNDRGATPKKDAIWACVARGDTPEEPVYLRNRAVASDWLAALLSAELAAGRRVLAGFDFPFGYPAGFAAGLTGRADPLAVWDWYAAELHDTPQGNDRFTLAGRINGMFPGEGPFWFNGGKPEVPGLPRLGTARQGTGLPERRLADARAKGAFTCWQLGGAGAVGSQAITGMAALAGLRHRFGAALAVWPFQPVGDAPLVLAEIWPSLCKDAVRAATGPGDIRDAVQVRVLAGALWRMQEAGTLDDALRAVPEEARTEEGWILGLGQEDALRAAAGRVSGLADTRPAAMEATGGAGPALRNDCFALPPGVHWTPVAEALALLRERMTPVTGIEEVPVAGATGRILAADHRALRANPPAANSAVDGYGFAHAALGVPPHRLPLVEGRAAAGGPFAGRVPVGHALRILTGAMLPPGVDTVVLQEDVRIEGGALVLEGGVKAGANTRRAGEDLEAGALALPEGHALRAPDLALLSALGLSHARVRRRLRVGVLSTGDELAAPGETTDPARTYDANRPMLLALAAGWGHAAVDLGNVADDRAALRARLDGAGVDVVLTSGGASAGDEDHVSALLREAGTLTAWRIALKPGRPLALGMWNGVPVFGLPGNPVAAFTCALIFARPALSALAGGGWPEARGYTVPAAFEKRKKAGRREYLRARLDAEGRAEVFRSEGSGRISGLSWAGGLVELEDGARHVRPGDPVRFLPYGSFGL